MTWAGLYNSRSSALETSLGGLGGKHISNEHGTTCRPLSRPALAQSRCSSSCIVLSLLQPPLLCRRNTAHAPAPDVAGAVLPLASPAVHSGAVAAAAAVPAGAPRPALAPAAARWPTWRSAPRALRNARRSSTAATPSATACTSSSCCCPCARHATQAQAASRWPPQPLPARLHTRRAPFLPRSPSSRSVPAPSARKRAGPRVFAGLAADKAAGRSA
jgi:hypothetical protein